MSTYTRLVNGRVIECKSRRSPFADIEEELRRLVGEGLKDREVGERLGLSEKQAWTQRERLQLPAAWPQGRPRKRKG